MLYTEFNIDIALEVRAEEVREETDAKWQAVVADKDAELADKDAELADKDAELADKDAELADKDAEIALLHAKLEELQPS
jgi:chromosome segregation ATPase